MVLAGTGPLGAPGEVGPAEAEADLTNRDLSKALMGARQQFRVPPRPDARLLVEVQAQDPNQRSGHLSLGWSWLELFSGHSPDSLRVGRWALPAYEGPARPDLFSGPGAAPPAPKPTATIGICIKIGLPADPMFRDKPGPHTTPADYAVPREHEGIRRPLPPPVQ